MHDSIQLLGNCLLILLLIAAVLLTLHSINSKPLKFRIVFSPTANCYFVDQKCLIGWERTEGYSVNTFSNYDEAMKFITAEMNRQKYHEYIVAIVDSKPN